MKKEYKEPMLDKVIMEIESPMMNESQPNDADAKKSGRIYEDEEAAPAATPKGFWDDEN